MNALVIRASEGHVAAPLIGNHPVVHHASYDTQHPVVKEKFGSEARWGERHREKVAMRTAVRLVAVGLEISEQNRPKRVPASIDQRARKMFLERAIALVLELDDFVVNQLDVPPWSTSLANLTFSYNCSQQFLHTPERAHSRINARA